jgi:hypothetical protein
MKILKKINFKKNNLNSLILKKKKHKNKPDIKQNQLPLHRLKIKTFPVLGLGFKRT